MYPSSLLSGIISLPRMSGRCPESSTFLMCLEIPVIHVIILTDLIKEKSLNQLREILFLKTGRKKENLWKKKVIKCLNGIIRWINNKKIIMDQEDGWFLDPSWLIWTSRHHWFKQGWTGEPNFQENGFQGWPDAEKKPSSFPGATPEGSPPLTLGTLGLWVTLRDFLN